MYHRFNQINLNIMKRLILLLCLLVTSASGNIFAQSKAELKNSFYDAESWILFEAYKDALPLYMQLLEKYPDNANFKYRIGQCYLNTPGEKDRAVKYLVDAVKNINPNYREGKFKESGAPSDALYYLANAYRIDNQLDSALKTYDLFKKNMDTEVYDTTVVNLQIQNCINAKELIANPEFIRKSNLGNTINESTSEFNPVMAENEKMLVFSKSEAFYDAILYSVKDNGKWSPPQNLNEILKVDEDLFPTSLSADGKTLYLYSSADYDGIIYSSTFANNTWSPLVKLNYNINTKYWESHATISQDNNNLYFTSNRNGTFGGLDIFVAGRDSTGDWGPAVNLGPVVNTPYNEESPFLTNDDKTLFFSSRGHFNMGGYDIFSSTRLENGEWTPPRNAGYPLNTTDDDVFFKPAAKGFRGFYSMDTPEGNGKLDIYQIEIFSDEHPRRITISGTATVTDLLEIYRDSVKISVLNDQKQDQTKIFYSNHVTRAYEFTLPHGEYHVNFEGYGGEKVTRSLILPITHPSDSYIFPTTVLPRTDRTADLYIESSRNISVTKGDSILFPLKVEPQSLLSVEVWTGGSRISSEKHRITSPDFDYKMAPRQGENRVVFNLTDRFSNSATADIFILRSKESSTEKLVRPEYGSLVSKKQTAAYLALLKNRADENQTELINKSAVEKQRFEKPDEILSWLKREAPDRSIKPEDIDKLALKVAVFDNVLTQAAVDLPANYSEGDLRKTLGGLDIYRENLKTWSDLQRYISEKSGGKFSSDDLNDLASFILTDLDPAIAVIRDKILVFGEVAEEGAVLRESITATDLEKIKTRGNWLKSFYDQAITRGLTDEKLSRMLSVISALPDTKAGEFQAELADYSEEPLMSSLKSTDLSKEKLRSPEDLILFLITANDQVKYPEESVFKSIATLIASKNITPETIKSRLPFREAGRLWIVWVIIGISLLFFFIMLTKRKKKEKE
jgi:hypothetical protein